LCIPDNSIPTILAFNGSLTNITNSVTGYISNSGVYSSGAEDGAGIIIPSAATISKLYIKPQTNTLNGNMVVTVRKNAADTALTCTVTSSSTSTFSDTTHSFTVSAGDILTFKLDTTAANSGSSYINTVAVLITA